MLKYVSVAQALKLFSLNNFTKKIYRKIGNAYGHKKSKNNLIDAYLLRSYLLSSLMSKYDVIKEGNDFLELGTGWMHWYSIYLSVFHKAHISMFDIWDNRQLARLKAMILEFINVMEKGENKYDRALDLFKEISKVESFEDLYRLLNLQYIIDPDGNLSHFSDNSFNCIFSVDVLEHVQKASVSKVVNDIYRILKPGGYSIHMIGIDDHLTHYDTKESPKKYLCYSDKIWRIFFENQVQYINRLQVSDWLTSFQSVNFQLQDKMTESCNIESLKIDKKYISQTEENLACVRLVIVHRKPVDVNKDIVRL